MSDVEEDLRTTSDTILAETDRLRDLEERKRELSASDEERVTSRSRPSPRADQEISLALRR